MVQGALIDVELMGGHESVGYESATGLLEMKV